MKWVTVNTTFWGDDADQAMVQDFVHCIRQQKEPRASGLDGLAGNGGGLRGLPGCP
ncbi:MAG: hypothetical protein ACOX57_05300 [Limnochordia bacterium]